MIVVAIFIFIFILGLLIFVHELGHFVMAKRAGMKVEEFGFGFPPRMFGIKRGETIYSINWIPLGGFVKIVGEDGGPNADSRAFGNKSYGSRFLVLIAGVTMNFVLAWLLLFLGFAFVGAPVEIDETVDASRLKISEVQITVVGVQADSPADHAGFRPGDAILSIDGRKFENIQEMITYAADQAGETVVYELERGEEVIFRDVTPRENPPEGSGPVVFIPASIAIAKYPILDAFRLSFVSFFSRALAILSAFGLLLKGLFTSGRLIEGLSGPVGIAVLTQDFVRLGFVYLVQFAAILSLNLGVINAFPFPALDGGRVLFLAIERIRGVKSLKWEQLANVVGFVLLILLMVAVTFRDVDRFSDQFRRLFERIF